jgi:hypothetical protein
MGIVMVVLLAALPAFAQSQRGPVTPIVEEGACPFEGCIFAEWTVNQPVEVRATRSEIAPVAFQLNPGERVQALTGVLVTTKAGRVQFRERTDIKGFGLRDPGESFFLLHADGEGFVTIWYEGQTYRQIDSTTFLNGVCDARPEKCAGRVVEEPESEWWVQIRTRSGRVGWTRESFRFNGKSAFGREPSAVSEIYESVSVHPTTANLQVVVRGGRMFAVPAARTEMGFHDIKLSPTGAAFGWVGSQSNAGATSYDIPTHLHLYWQGQLRTFKGIGLPVWDWAFLDNGRRFAFHQETVHGGIGIRYELHDVESGRLIEVYQPEFDEEFKLKKPEPAWVRQLSDQRK